MANDTRPHPGFPTLGGLLRSWRQRTGRSQLDIALEVGVSSRHLSFMESDRARPSEPMLHALLLALEVPQNEQNVMWLAAGLRPRPGMYSLDLQSQGDVIRVIERMKQAHIHAPLLVKDQIWDIVDANDAAKTMFAKLTGHALLAQGNPVNVLELIFAPDLLRPHIENWDEIADLTVRRVRYETGVASNYQGFQAVLDRVCTAPGFQSRWQAPDCGPTLTFSTRYIIRWHDRLHAFDSVLLSLGSHYDAILNGIKFDVLYQVP